MGSNFGYEVITCQFWAKKMNRYQITLASMEGFRLINENKNKEKV